MSEKVEYNCEFLTSIETFEYSDEIKAFYKDGIKIVERLGLFK